MGSVLQPEELYDELANRIRAEDGPGTKRVFRQLLDAGRPRAEIISRISRLIEQRSPDKTLANGSEEIRWPKLQSLEPSQVEEQRKPSAWTDTPVSNAADQRLDGSAERTSLNPEIARTEADPVQRAGTSYELSPEPQITAGSDQPEKPLMRQTAGGERENAIKGFEESEGDAFYATIERNGSRLKKTLIIPEYENEKGRLLIDGRVYTSEPSGYDYITLKCD